jgi:hypothetical protein
MANMWLWCAWLENRGPSGTNKTPLYAVLVPTEEAVRATRSQVIQIGAEVEITYADVVTAAVPVMFPVGEAGTIDLTSAFPEAPRIPVTSRRRVLLDFFGHSPAHADCWIGGTDATAVLPSSEVAVEIARLFDQELGLSLREGMLQHLGGFDQVHLPASPEKPSCYGAEVEGPRGSGQETLVLRRARAVHANLRVCVTFQQANEKVFDRLFNWDASSGGVLRVPMPAGRCGYGVKIYDEGGDLLFDRPTFEPYDIHFTTMVSDRTLILTDRLSRRASSLGTQEALSASHAVAVGVSGSRVGASPRSAVQRLGALRDRGRALLSEPTSDRWFARTVRAELDLIDHLNQLFNAADVSSAAVVDPFFGVEALERFLLRVRRIGLDLTIVASWGRTDPDDAVRIGASAAEAVALSARRAIKILEAVEPVLAPKVRFLNVVAASGDQAFHDRYLALRMHDGTARVFLLSNSFNAMAANYPFCMSEVRGRAALEADKYIRGLENGKDQSTAASLQVTVDWPASRSPLV